MKIAPKFSMMSLVVAISFVFTIGHIFPGGAYGAGLKSTKAKQSVVQKPINQTMAQTALPQSGMAPVVPVCLSGCVPTWNMPGQTWGSPATYGGNEQPQGATQRQTTPLAQMSTPQAQTSGPTQTSSAVQVPATVYYTPVISCWNVPITYSWGTAATYGGTQPIAQSTVPQGPAASNGQTTVCYNVTPYVSWPGYWTAYCANIP